MALVILVLRMIQLQSFQRTLLVLATAPLGIVGVTAALLVFDRPFGFVTLLGVISLTGMTMRNSLILVDQIDRNLEAGSDAWNAIVDATVRRLRPILMTALAAILAMTPLSRSVFWGPMAGSIMGGLLAATVLTLFVEPALSALFYRVKRPKGAVGREGRGEAAPGAGALAAETVK
jgi:multidrug efflux pump